MMDTVRCVPSTFHSLYDCFFQLCLLGSGELLFEESSLLAKDEGRHDAVKLLEVDDLVVVDVGLAEQVCNLG